MEKFNLKMIDGKQAYNTKEEAEKKAEEIGCGGSHEHEVEGVVYYMPCVSHEELNIERVCCSSDQDDDDQVAQKLIALGEDIDENKWEAIYEQDVDYQKEDKIDEIIHELNSQSEEKLSLLGKIWKFVSTGVASPNKPSEQDKKIKENYFKVRYYYSPRRVGDNARRFCRAMKGANKLYRKEDIIRMGKEPVNKGWGPKGDSATYSIWLYKGGGNCHHSWRRVTYKSKLAKIDIRDAQNIIGTRQAAILGYKVTNPYQVSIQPRNLPNKGFLPGNPQGN
tara:strand:+ start:862 stop:1698 length:837 start_codon:yes stop_codon:yes gene_type:complete